MSISLRSHTTQTRTEGYHPETEVLLYSREPKQLSQLQREDILMGPDGRPRHILSVETVPNTTIPLYKLGLSYNRQLTCTSKDIQVVMAYRPTTKLVSGHRKSAYIRAGWFDGSKIVSKNFAIASESAKAWYPTREIAEEAAWEHMQASTPVQAYSEITYPLASIIKYGAHTRHYFPLFYPRGFQYIEQPVTVDPYYLGLWLGDGDKHAAVIYSNPSQVIEDYLASYAAWLDMKLTVSISADPEVVCCRYLIVRGEGNTMQLNKIPNGFNAPYIPDLPDRRKNKLVEALRDLGVTHERLESGSDADMKHIPDLYLFNSRDVRLKVLAGFLDSDGTYNTDNNSYCFAQSVQRHMQLFLDVVFLAKSLGFYCSVPYHCQRPNPHHPEETLPCILCYISGDIDEIPCLLTRKKARPRNNQFHRNPRMLSVVDFTILDPAPFVSITADQDNLFLRDDFLVLRGCQHVDQEELLSQRLSHTSIHHSQPLYHSQPLNQSQPYTTVASLQAPDTIIVSSDEETEPPAIVVISSDEETDDNEIGSASSEEDHLADYLSELRDTL